MVTYSELRRFDKMADVDVDAFILLLPPPSHLTVKKDAGAGVLHPAASWEVTTNFFLVFLFLFFSFRFINFGSLRFSERNS